ncbi:MAG: glutaredoxin family protein [Candidatus Aenigmatarchaeota archaeon]
MTDEKVKVYTTPTCPYCDQLKSWLKENDIDFEEFNVQENKEKAKEMIQKTGQRGVPQTIIGDEAIIGFQPGKIEKVLNE